MGASRPQERKKWIDDLYEGLAASGASVINVAGTVSNQGRFDDLMAGGSAAMLTTHEAGQSFGDSVLGWYKTTSRYLDSRKRPNGLTNFIQTTPHRNTSTS
jgi:hypothetical protein